MATFKDSHQGVLWGDVAAEMLVTHILTHFPHQHGVNLTKTMFCGLDLLFRRSFLWLIHFFGGLPAQMAPSCSFTAAQRDNVLTAVNCHC